jgi:hypothetical protein
MTERGDDVALEQAFVCESGAIQGALTPSLVRVAPLRLQADDTLGAIDALRASIAHSRDTGERIVLNTILDSLIVVLTNLGAVEATVVAYGVIQAQTFGPGGFLSGSDLERREQHLSVARARLSDADYDAAIARGGSMSHDEVFEYALNKLDQVLTDHQDG